MHPAPIRRFERPSPVDSARRTASDDRTMERRVLLVVPTTTYRATDFLAAAASLGVDVVVGSDRRQALESRSPGGTITLDFGNHDRAVESVLAFASDRPLHAVVGVDDETTLLATRISAALGLRHNPAEAVQATRDKHLFRTRLEAAGLRGPRYARVPIDTPRSMLADQIPFPVVVKPLFLSASRGVLRADDVDGRVAAFATIARILADPETRNRRGDRDHVLVESYLPGDEVALEGLLIDGQLRQLALFDKPDPLVGPTFEETLFVTPSRLPVEVQASILAETGRACSALGLIDGPIHAELRVSRGTPTLLEVAARSIGGLCARSLRFGAGISLEELVLRHALGEPVETRRESAASGVLMFPVPRAGTLREIGGLEQARGVDRVVEVTMTVHRGARLVPLPEGHRYVGFAFARGETPQQVEAALREAGARIRLEIDPD